MKQLHESESAFSTQGGRFGGPYAHINVVKGIGTQVSKNNCTILLDEK